MKKDKPGSPGIEAMNPTTRPDVTQLTRAWQAKASDVVTGAPIVDEQAGRVYFGDWGGNIYAVNLSDGSGVWKKQVAKPAMKAPWHGFTGTGVMADGKLFFATAEDGTAYAINPRDGSVL
jgi:outer membrane protein assembly factor BamB